MKAFLLAFALTLATLTSALPSPQEQKGQGSSTVSGWGGGTHYGPGAGEPPQENQGWGGGTHYGPGVTGAQSGPDGSTVPGWGGGTHYGPRVGQPGH